MNNTQELLQNNPPRSLGIPTVPIPQTNLGLLEHTGVPIEPQDPITDIPPDFTWMVSQWKLVDTFVVKDSDAVGTISYTTPIVASKKDVDFPYWTTLPFHFSKWWTGSVSYRFTLVKPPRVTGKLLVVYRQDAFHNITDTAQTIKDTLLRSIIKEWDISQSSQFEFDLTGSVPIRARPSQWIDPKDPFKVKSLSGTGISYYQTPWTEREMGAIQIQIAQQISPGGIFPDQFTVLVEKCIKTPKFMTPTDSRTHWIVAVEKEPDSSFKK